MCVEVYGQGLVRWLKVSRRMGEEGGRGGKEGEERRERRDGMGVPVYGGAVCCAAHYTYHHAK